MPDSPRRAGPIRFGVFEVDVRSGELRKAGVRLTLQEQPLQVLAMLLERPGEVVTRDELRKQLWPHDTFVDFDHGLNAAVNRLRDTLGDSASSPRFVETLPRRGYRFIAQVNLASEGLARTQASPDHDGASDHAATGAGSPPRVAATAPQSHPRVWLAACLVLGSLAATGVWWFARTPALANAPGEKPMHLVPIAIPSGVPTSATLSPDGNAAAFAWWSGKRGDGWRICVTSIGSGTMMGVTPERPAEQGDDYFPSWSPDGRSIAYIHHDGQTTAGDSASGANHVYITSPLGGGEHRVSDFRVAAGRMSWSPDSTFIAAMHDSGAADHLSAGIYLVPLDGSKPRRMVSTPAGASHAILSPEGRDIAYVFCEVETSCDVYAAHLDHDYAQIGSTHRVSKTEIFGIKGLSWTADGRDLVYGAALPRRLWRTPATGTQSPEAVEIGGFSATDPDIGRAGHRLAFTRKEVDENIYVFAVGNSVSPFLTSSFRDIDPEYSPNGTRVAFASARSGALEIWVANTDGTHARQLTNSGGHVTGSPHWSPDGRYLAFDGADNDTRLRAWTIDAEGGTARQLTSGPGEQCQPTWSADGAYIYYSSDARGQPNIWRTPSAGGPAEQVTHTGAGKRAVEARSGRYLVYQSATGRAPLLLLRSGSTAAKQLVACVRQTAFTIADDWVYYVGCENSDSPALHRLDPLTGRDQVLGLLPNIVESEPHISVSPDARGVLYTRLMSPEKSYSLVLIENFR